MFLLHLVILQQLNLLKFDHWIRYIALGFSFIILILITVFIRKWFSQFYSVEELLADEESNGYKLTMKILIITHTFAPALNGQAVFTTNLAEGLVENKHQVRVLVPAVDRPAFEIRNGVEIQAISALDLRFIHKDLSLAFAFHRQIDQLITDFQPDLIHLQDPSPISQSAMKIAKNRNIPVLATHHPGPAIWAPYLPGDNPIVKNIVVPLVWKVFMHYLNSADWVSAPSRAAAKMLQNHGVMKNISPISCGVRIEEFTGNELPQVALRNKFGIPLDKKIFVFIGRLDEEKKVDVLIDAMSFVKDNQVVLVLAGNGLKNGKYHQLVATLGLGERIQFLGFCTATGYSVTLCCL